MPECTTLELFKHYGVLTKECGRTEVTKEIALVIEKSVHGLKLKDALIRVQERDNGADLVKQKRLLLGILSLVYEGKLLLSETPNIVSDKIIDKENVFYPQGLHVELTRSCNLNCYYCYKNADYHHHTVPNLETGKLLELLLDLKNKGLKVVELTGGEPLLHPKFMSILEFCCHNFSLVSILTNGTLITKEFARWAQSYKDKIVFSISLDSFDKTEYEKKSGIIGSFQKAVDGIKILTYNGFFVRASMAVDEGNWKQIEQTLLFAKSLGVAKFTYSPIIPIGRANQLTVWNNTGVEEVASFEKYIVRKYHDFIHTLEGHSLDELLAPGGCGAGSRTFVMNEAGVVRMCATDEQYGIIGDLSKQTSDDVFSNPLCAIVDELVFPNANLCEGCNYLSFCVSCPIKTKRQIGLIGEENCRWLRNNVIAKKWYQLEKDRSTT